MDDAEVESVCKLLMKLPHRDWPRREPWPSLEQSKDITEQDVELLQQMIEALDDFEKTSQAVHAINKEARRLKQTADLHSRRLQQMIEKLDAFEKTNEAVHARKSELERRLNRVKARLERLKTSDAASDRFARVPKTVRFDS